jgi:hypothetical protein
MRQKSILLWALAAIAVVALVAVNLSLREDPEPDFGSTASALRPERRSEGTPISGRLVEVRAEQPPVVGQDPTSEDDEEADEPRDGEPPPSCEHAFVPSVRGEWRRYAWRQSGEDQVAELRLEAVRSRELPEGDREVTWRVQVTASADHAPLAAEELTTRCVPGREAEEPWFGILERSLGLTLTEEPGRWRWPARLAPGDRFEGRASFDPQGADMRMPADVRGPQLLRVSRRHVVGEREQIVVPAGRYRAFRVDYEEQHAFGERGESGTGTVWVAPEVGLVKSRAENSHGVVQTIELVALGRRSR